jgi:O-acetylhomoserine (thiol)-lyase
MVRPDEPGFDTLAVHAGAAIDPVTGSPVPPLHRSAGFVFDDAEHAAALFDLDVPGYIYSRIANPTVGAFEERIAALEGGSAAVATASGQAALHLAVATLMGAGGHIVSSSALYGGTANLFLHTLPRFGITTTFVDPRDHDGFRRAIRPETRLVYGETIGNPTMAVLDLPAVSAIAHEQGVPLLVDNTFATPYLCRPFEWGADLVLHSATKFISGHGTVIGGVVVEGGGFDWVGSGRFPRLTEPSPTYHGLDFVDEFGPAAFSNLARADALRDFGACMAPDVAWLLLQGLQTLGVRVERHLANTRRSARVPPPPMGWPGCPTPTSTPTPTGRWPPPSSPGVAARSSRSPSKGGGRPGPASSSRSRCSPTSPTSATSAPWSSTPPPPPTAR